MPNKFAAVGSVALESAEFEFRELQQHDNLGLRNLGLEVTETLE